MIHISTNSDGGNTEGIGAMVQYQLFCYCLAKQLNIEYIFTGFKNLHHWQYNSLDQDTFVNDVNRFFSFPVSKSIPNSNTEKIKLDTLDHRLINLIKSKNDLIIDASPHALMQYGQANILEIEKNRWIKDLYPNINISQNINDPIYKDNSFNIAIHIRKYTQTDCDPDPVRDLYDSSKQVYYSSLVKHFLESYKDKNTEIHIYSQGKESDFDFLKHEHVQLHIEEHPLTSLYSMIKSDIFVMANSSLSYIASLYRDNITYKKHNFYHTTYSHNVISMMPSGRNL